MSLLPAASRLLRGFQRPVKPLCSTAPWTQAFSGTSEAPGNYDGLLVVPFPKLSHTMTSGKLVRWLKQPGERVAMYDVLFEVVTEELTEEVFKVDDFAGEVHLLVESQEEGWLAAVWHPASESKAVQVGTPVAVVCEDKEDVDRVAKAYKCPTSNVYDEHQPQVPLLTWQSFLKSGTKKVKCMG